MVGTKRKRHTEEFKAKVALEAIRGVRTLSELSSMHRVMSQNRQEARDRLHAMRDYQVNLKAELEIRHLHQKVDHLLSHQWERLVEIQEIQMELISEVRARR